MIHFHEAIRSLYSNAVNIIGNDLESVEAFDAENNLITLDKTAITNEHNTLLAAANTASQAAVTAKESAIAKLSALGLTADEIAHLIP